MGHVFFHFFFSIVRSHEVYIPSAAYLCVPCQKENNRSDIIIRAAGSIAASRRKIAGSNTRADKV